MNRKYYILTILLCWTSILFAQDLKFTASVNRNEVGTNEQFQVDFSVNGNVEGFNPPSFSGFEVLAGPSQSTSMSSINGNTSMNTTFSYVLAAPKEGDFVIGPATVVVNGRRLNSTPVHIKVVKGRAAPQNNAAQNAPDNTVSAGNTSDLSKLIFLREVVDKNNVYQGQQIVLNYRLYTRVQIEQNQLDKLPDLTGFWNEDVKNTQQQPQVHIETYKGVKYNVIDIKQTILFPEHAGNITIDPIEMTFVVQQPVAATNIMDQFFGSYKEVKYKAKSTPLVIHVKPLPEAGKPEGFTGAVGKFSIEASVDKTSLKTNDALNYKVKVTGAGNIKLLKNLNTAFPEDFEKYDPKISDTVTEDANGVSGSRIYNYLLIPRHKGDYTIGELKFAYFNPTTNRYVSLSSKAFHVNVAQGATENNVTAFSTSNQQDIKLLDKDIRYIKTSNDDLYRDDDLFYGSVLYYLLLFIGPVLCGAAYAYRRWDIKNNSDLVKVKNKRAGKVAAKHLASAQIQLTANNTQGFYEDVFKGLYGYLSDKLNILYANLDRETIAAVLQERKVDSQLINKLLDTLDLCEMARYAPVTHISKQEVFEKAKGIINDLENEI